MAGSLTRDQRIAEARRTGQCGLILADFSTCCPRRNGPVNANPDHPSKVGYPGANGYCTCSGCEHFLGLDWNNYVCTHPNARAVAARALAERIRAGGAGVTAFYTPTGPGTVIEEGKEKRYFNGRPHLLEYALKADFALVRAWKADTFGNLIFRGTQRQFNPIMAMAAEITIAEVDEIVEPGEINPNCVIVPCIYVKRIVRISANPGFPRHLEMGDFQVREER